MRPIYVTFLNRLDIEELALSDEEILAAIETSLAAQGRGRGRDRAAGPPRGPGQSETAISTSCAARSPRRSYRAAASRSWATSSTASSSAFRGTRRRPAARSADRRAAGILDECRDHRHAHRRHDGGRRQVSRAQELEDPGSHRRPGLSSYWNVRLLDHLFDFDEIRVHSKRPESRNGFAERRRRDLGKKVAATDDWRSCVEGADIVVEASRLRWRGAVAEDQGGSSPPAFVVPMAR